MRLNSTFLARLVFLFLLYVVTFFAEGEGKLFFEGIAQTGIGIFIVAVFVGVLFFVYRHAETDTDTTADRLFKWASFFIAMISGALPGWIGYLILVIAFGLCFIRAIILPAPQNR